jgi:hypothetical protein
MPVFRFDVALLRVTAIFSVLSFFLTATLQAEDPQVDAKVAKQPVAKTLAFKEDSSWKPSHFGGDGPIEMKDGVLSLGFGDPFTGVRWEGEFPKINYEISLEARRVGGFDFFCGLTLPIADQRFSLILGGWGGSLIGLSSIDGLDASNNETMLIRDFEKGRWYKVKVRVTDKKITVWLDEDDIINVDREGRVFDIRSEMEESTPMGVAAFQSEAEIRNVVVKMLPQAAETNEAKTETKAPTK